MKPIQSCPCPYHGASYGQFAVRMILLILIFLIFPAGTLRAAEFATLKCAEMPFVANVVVNGEALGTATDMAKEFKFAVQPGPSTLIFENNTYKTIFVTNFTARPGAVYTLENVRYEPRHFKEILADFVSSEPGMATSVSSRTAAPVSAELKGSVLVIDPKENFVVLNLGQVQNVKPHDEFLLSRDGKLIAKVQVSSVQKERSLANIVSGWEFGPVHEGDQAVLSNPIASDNAPEGGISATPTTDSERLRRQRSYGRTAEYWGKIIAANAASQKKLDAIGLIAWNTFEKRSQIHKELGTEFGRFDETAVDPELLALFKGMRTSYKLVAAANDANVEKLQDFAPIFAYASGTGGESLTGLPAAFSKCQTTGDVLFIGNKGLSRNVKLLNASLAMMEYVYGQKFTQLSPAMRQELCVFSKKIRDEWAD